ncbi:MAG: CARDB domain-containing protein [SAR324 cluster bacterium]|nr:CARDB domain-containing protein [SAR324 cluster bacterium]MED5482877.1 CARDB domain-containing protein [SAR324 cluster bacterium]
MSRILQLKLIFFGIIVLLLPNLSQASQSPRLKIIAIVLSKTCPLPDGPDMSIDSPDSILKSISNPDCPKHGDNQLVQTAIANQGFTPKQVGVEIKIKVNAEEVKTKRLRKVYTIQAGDTARVLHEIAVENTGLYQISVRVWDANFKRILVNTTTGDERYFFIASPQDIEIAKTQLASGIVVSGKRIISPLRFDPPDLRWESVQILPKHALRGEKLRLRLNLMNAGGDIVKDIASKIQYYNVKQPMRKSVIAMPNTRVMAPGEIITFDLEYVLPDDQLLGNYQIIATVDPENELEELKENNNITKSNVIKLSDIKLLLPTDKFSFEENGLFLFQWDSLSFSEFKIQVGVDEKFEDSGSFFDLPQGNRWIADKELVPLAGELPGMAMGLMRAKEKNQLYWRVIGRQASGRQAISGINRFSITPVNSDSS